jgi:hypothetical protein
VSGHRRAGITSSASRTERAARSPPSPPRASSPCWSGTSWPRSRTTPRPGPPWCSGSAGSSS